MDGTLVAALSGRYAVLVVFLSQTTEIIYLVAYPVVSIFNHWKDKLREQEAPVHLSNNGLVRRRRTSLNFPNM